MASNVLTAASPASTYTQLLHLGTGTSSVATIRNGLGTATVLSLVSGGAKVIGTFEATGTVTMGGALNVTGAVNATGALATGSGVNKTTLVSSATAARTITFPDASGTVMLDSGGAAEQMFTLTSDKTHSVYATASEAATELSFTPDASSTYKFDAYILFSSASTAVGIKVWLKFPVSPAMSAASAVGGYINATPAFVPFSGATTNSGTWLALLYTTSVYAANEAAFIRVSGFYKTSAGGQSPLVVAFGPEVDGTAVKLLAGTFITHQKIS